MPAGRADVYGQTWTLCDHGKDPDDCSYASYSGVGNEAVYYAIFSVYVPPKSAEAERGNKDICFNWYERCRAMLKRNRFGIVVFNEANLELQRMMREGEDPIPAEWSLYQGLVGNPRPMEGDVDKIFSKVRVEKRT